MLRTALLTLATAGVLAGCGSSSSAPHPPTSLPCPARPGGMLCIKVLTTNRATVSDVIGYLSSSSPTLAGKTWRLVLDRYACDPQSACRPAATYPGPTRRGLPPESTSCRAIATGETITAPGGCHDTLAQEMATHGDWAGFYRFADGRPKTFGSRVWLCVSEQVRDRGAWRRPGTLAPARVGACSSVQPA